MADEVNVIGELILERYFKRELSEIPILLELCKASESKCSYRKMEQLKACRYRIMVLISLNEWIKKRESLDATSGIMKGWRMGLKMSILWLIKEGIRCWDVYIIRHTSDYQRYSYKLSDIGCNNQYWFQEGTQMSMVRQPRSSSEGWLMPTEMRMINFWTKYFCTVLVGTIIQQSEME